jgi:regulator of sigma E protease
MVTIHEFGHYLAGKLLHFKINEFSIGFGKALYSHTSKKTGEVFSIRLIPLGGYCAFEGEEENSEAKGAFNKMAPWKRIIVLFSGAFFNILSGILFSIILLCATGYDIPKVYKIDSIPVVTNTTVDWKSTDKIVEINGELVDETSPTALSYSIKMYAENKGIEESTYNVKYYRNGVYLSTSVDVNFETNTDIQENDVIWKINGTNIDFTHNNTFTSLIQNVEGNTATFTIKRDGKYQDITVNLFDYGVKVTDESGNVLNSKVIGITSVAYKFNLWESIARCVPFTFGLGYKVLESLWLLISGSLGLEAVGGPITTITTIATYTQSNFASFFILLPLIAVNLGIFNLLPIPALDGSKIVFTTIEWIRGKPVNPKVENAIHNIGFIILMGLVVIADLYHLIFIR